MHLIPTLYRFDPNYKSYNYLLIPKSTQNLSFSQIPTFHDSLSSPIISHIKRRFYGQASSLFYPQLLLGHDHHAMP